MCGICGVLRLGDEPIDPDGRLIDQMTDALERRGPDDRGTWTDGQIALGNRRLAVIDLSPAGHQPMAGENDAVHLTYNGEVYNFRELRQRYRLEKCGHRFTSSTDTEVLLHLFEELGPRMFGELNGMFGLAVWDGRSETLYLARDRYGIKPLFYQQDAAHFRFASEIKSILVDKRVTRRASLQALHDFLTFDYIPGPQTAFEDVHELPPGHWLEVGADGAVQIQPFWVPSYTPDESLDARAAIATAGELLDQAVHRQLVADVPIGVLLSGGLDSSALVALMARHTNGPIRTYAIGFEEPSFDERGYAARVAHLYGAHHQEVVITADKVRDLLPEYLEHIDEPYADGSAIPTYYVSQLAAEDVTVVLSGEGGDEAFGGYETYSAYQASRWFGRVPRWARQGLIAPLVRSLPVSDRKLSLEFRLKRFIGGQDIPVPQAHLWWRTVLTEAEKYSLYSADLLARMTAEPSVRHFENAFALNRSGDDLAGLMLIDSLVFMPDDLMVKNDRMTMAHSLEARVPMTDNDLMDFMATVPTRLKLNRWRKKHVLRGAMAGLLPREVLNKKKVGLEMPYSSWLKRELNDLMMSQLGPDAVRRSGLFEPRAIQGLIDEHMQSRRDNGRALWGLMNYMMWRELYGVT